VLVADEATQDRWNLLINATCSSTVYSSILFFGIKSKDDSYLKLVASVSDPARTFLFNTTVRWAGLLVVSGRKKVTGRKQKTMPASPETEKTRLATTSQARR
jgi:hypothetical protein